jgi:hypothetical protein
LRPKSEKLDAGYKSGPSKRWLKIKNPKAPAAIRALMERSNNRFAREGGGDACETSLLY